MADGIADPRPRQPVGLGKGAQPDHARVVERKRQRRAFGSAFDIGFIQHKKRAFGQVCHRGDKCFARVRATHRVVGIGEVNQFGIYSPRHCEQGVRILEIGLVGYLVQHASITRHMVVEGRIGSVGGDDRISGCDEKADQIGQKTVDAFSDHDVVCGRVQMLRQSCAQIVAFRIAIHPLGGLRHGADRAGRWAEHVLIGTQTGIKTPGPGTLLRFRPHEGNGGRQRFGYFSEAKVGHVA